MNPAPTEASAPPGAGAAAPGARLLPPARLALLLLCIGALGAAAVAAGGRSARTALVDLGPTDGSYARGFREIEQDGAVFFRWSSVPSSSITVPVRFCGPGSVRLRVRRHFVDPALLSVFLGGSLVGQTSVRARDDVPYEVINYPISKAICGSEAVVTLESSVGNERPLGVAVDWLELRTSVGFALSPRTIARGSACLIIMGLALLLAGATPSLVAFATLPVTGLLAWSFAADPVAGERILRGGLVALVLVLLLAGVIGSLGAFSGLSRRGRVLLIGLTLLVVASRSIFLHPSIFYPDYRVHALVLEALEKSGLRSFVASIFEIQYARSLGLQQIDGRWYPFPYPPGSYVIAEGVASLFGLNVMDASLVAGIAAASAIPLVTVALGLSAGLGESLAILGALFVAFHPLLLRRMALGYFPGLMGQIFDGVALLVVLKLVRAGAVNLRGAAALGAALLGAFLVYTQSIANFGLLVAGVVAAESLWRRSGGLRSALLLGVVATLALAGSVGIFYVNYWPVAQSIVRHQPLPESRVLDRLDQLRRANPSPEAEPAEDPSEDAFVGDDLNPVRGLARLGSRLWRFNGPYAFALLPGLWLLWRGCDRTSSNLVLAWASVCLWINLLAAGLPSPNGFQHLKDLEFSTPLLALALGVVSRRLWDLRPILGVAFFAGWAALAAHAFASEVADRVMVLYGH